MKPCWEQAGLTPHAADTADKSIDRMVALFTEIAESDIVDAVVKEAMFRVFELQERSPSFQEKYKKCYKPLKKKSN